MCVCVLVALCVAPSVLVNFLSVAMVDLPFGSIISAQPLFKLAAHSSWQLTLAGGQTHTHTSRTKKERAINMNPARILILSDTVASRLVPINARNLGRLLFGLFFRVEFSMLPSQNEWLGLKIFQ